MIMVPIYIIKRHKVMALCLKWSFTEFMHTACNWDPVVYRANPEQCLFANSRWQKRSIRKSKKHDAGCRHTWKKNKQLNHICVLFLNHFSSYCLNLLITNSAKFSHQCLFPNMFEACHSFVTCSLTCRWSLGFLQHLKSLHLYSAVSLHRNRWLLSVSLYSPSADVSNTQIGGHT